MDQRHIKTSVGGGISSKHIFEEIISLENLFLAWREFRRGKRQKFEVQQFEFNLEDNLFQLHNELKEKTYQPLPHQSFYVSDPKLRHIHKAHIRDRVLHQAVFRILYPIFDKLFIYDSYSSRSNKGTHAAVNRLEIFLRATSKNYQFKVFGLKCDIRKFFDSIDQKILSHLIKKEVFDTDVLWLVEKIIKSFKGDTGVGLPLGNVTSQLFANIYLNELDQFIKQKLKIKFYVRYCDDFLIIAPDGNFKNLINTIRDFLAHELKLELHPHKLIISSYHQGIDFLGYVLRPYHRILRTKTKKRLFKKINEENLSSYLGILKHCNSFKIKKEIEKLHLKKVD